MSDLTPMDNLPSGSSLTTSREQALARLTKGTKASYFGCASMIAVGLGDLLGFSGTGIQMAQFGAALLMWLGCMLMISGVPHLRRFGTRRGVLALSSLVAAGMSGLVAVAEMFESFFLESTWLQGFDGWALAIAVVLFLGGIALLRTASMEADNTT